MPISRFAPSSSSSALVRNYFWHGNSSLFLCLAVRLQYALRASRLVLRATCPRAYFSPARNLATHIIPKHSRSPSLFTVCLLLPVPGQNRNIPLIQYIASICQQTSFSRLHSSWFIGFDAADHFCSDRTYKVWHKTVVRIFTASGNPPKPRAGILFYPPHTSTTIESSSPTNLRVSGVLFNVLSSYLLPSLAMGLNYNAIQFSHRGLH